MTRSALLLIPLLAFSAPGVTAQAHEHDHEAMQYAGLQDRAIKALSPEDIAGLRAGEGMGFALAAELNGLPGPKHVLELASQLDLSAEQVESVRNVFSAMRAEATALGEALIEAERHLDMMFAQRHATEVSVRERTGEVAAIRGNLRATHLNAHLATEALLTPEQVSAYVRLRGYAPAG